MANPNIVGITTVIGITTSTNLSTTNQTLLLNNAPNSNTVYKINSIIASNINGVSAADCTLSLFSQASAGGTEYKIASTISVSADSTLVILDKASSIYLQEDRSIAATASAGNYLCMTISYEQIS